MEAIAISTHGKKDRKQLLTFQIFSFTKGSFDGTLDDAILILEGAKIQYSIEYRNLSLSFNYVDDCFAIFGERWETEKEFQERCERDGIGHIFLEIQIGRAHV